MPPVKERAWPTLGLLAHDLPRVLAAKALHDLRRGIRQTLLLVCKIGPANESRDLTTPSVDVLVYRHRNPISYIAIAIPYSIAIQLAA